MKEGWEIKKLGEVCEVIAGQSPEGRFYNSVGNGIPFYQGKKEYGEKYIGEPTKWTTKVTKEAEAGDILMSVRAPVGPVNFAIQQICIGRGLAAIRAGKLVDREYLYNFLVHHENEIEGNTGAVFNSINKKQIESIGFPLPPRPEQQRIVSILDAAFAAIDKAKANAEQNLRNAKELFESYLQGVFENGDWAFVKLSDMATNITDGDHMPPPKSELGLPFITISNINKQTHKIDFSDTFKVPQKYYDNLKPNRKPIKGDVLYTVTGSYGIPVLIENDSQFCFQRHIGLIRPSKNLDSKLLYYWILSPQAISQANETATGTAQKTVSLKSLRNFSFPNIPLNEQDTIVRQLDALRAEAQKLEAVYQKKIDDLEELRKSILQMAFAGELKTKEAVSV
jgi:type I restriction enzyme, S subunit